MKQEDGHDLTKAGGNPEDELSAFEQFSLDFQSGLNGVLYILCKEVETNSLFVVMGMLMDFFQLVAFPFYNRIPFPWNTETIGWFQSIANYARICTLPAIVAALSHIHRTQVFVIRNLPTRSHAHVRLGCSLPSPFQQTSSLTRCPTYFASFSTLRSPS